MMPQSGMMPQSSRMRQDCMGIRYCCNAVVVCTAGHTRMQAGSARMAGPKLDPQTCN